MLVTQAEIVSNCINNKNFSTSLIKDQYIETAELQHVKPVLGSDFYYDIVNDESSYSTLLNGGTYTTSDSKTYSFQGLKKTICFFAFFESLPYIFTQITNQGLMQNNTEFSNNVSKDQRADYRNTIYSQAQSLMNEVKEYIHENLETYTLYSLGTDKSETVKIIGGLILGKK